MSVKVKKQLSLDKILSRVDELDIYKKYIGDVKIKQLISSPLRSGDSDPSFRLYHSPSGQLRYVDYGTGERGNIVDFVMHKYPGMSYGNLLERMWEDMQCAYLPITNKSIHAKQKLRSTYKKILVKKRKSNKDDIAFWNSWGITIPTLEWARTSPISKFWIDKNMYGCRTPSYAYDLFTEWKIYRPHEDKMRFIAGGTALQGYGLLPDKGEICVIQKSYKDVMLLHEFGIPSFAPQAESVDVPSDIMEDILERFDNVYIWGDPDETGEVFTQRHEKMYGIKGIKNTDDTKDITDHCKKYGKESAKNMTNNLLSM